MYCLTLKGRRWAINKLNSKGSPFLKPLLSGIGDKCSALMGAKQNGIDVTRVELDEAA